MSREAVVDHLRAEQQFLQRLALALARDESSAQDLVQETMVTAWQRSPSDRPSRPWLARVMRRLAGHERRSAARRARRERIAARNEIQEVDQTIELHALVSREIQALPKAQARVIALRYGEGLGPSAIADRLDLPLPTVKSQLQRGLQRLRERLDSEHGGLRSAWALVAVRPGALEPARAAWLGWWVMKPAMALVASLLVWWAGSMFLGGDAEPADAGLAPSEAMASSGAQAGGDEPGERPTQALRVSGKEGSRAVAGERNLVGQSEAEPMRRTPNLDSVPKLSMELADGTPEAYLRLRLDGSWDQLLSGRVFFDAAGLPTRTVELRGRETVSESGFTIRVPALAEVVISGRLDGLRFDPIPVQTPDHQQWVEVVVPLEVDPNQAYLSLSFADGLDWEGERMTLRLRAGDPETGLEMSMRQPTVRDGRLEVGWVPSGDLGLLLLAGTGGNAAQEASHGAFFRTTLASREKRQASIRMEPTVPLYLRLADSLPVEISAGVRLEYPGGLSVKAGLKYGESFTTRLSKGGLVQVLPGCLPGPLTLRIQEDGLDDLVYPLILHPGEPMVVPIHLE